MQGGKGKRGEVGRNVEEEEGPSQGVFEGIERALYLIRECIAAITW